MIAPSNVTPKGRTTKPSGMAWSGRATRKSALGKDMPFLTAKAAATPQRIWVDALAATTGPSVTKKPKVEANPTMPDTRGPATVDNITGTCEANVAEYPTVGM